MDAQDLQIRRLLPADAPLYRDIRLDALRLDPEAFGSTFARESAQPLSWFAERLAGSVVLAALRAATPIGIAGYYVPEGSKTAHKGIVWGAFVRPEARNGGVGRRLIQALIAEATGQVEQLQLSVVSDNGPARRLYVNLGFVEYGVERRSLKHEGRCFDEVLMVKFLAPVSD
jgi:ribosomal protein S18 acetylase RimI-like enzyme